MYHKDKIDELISIDGVSHTHGLLIETTEKYILEHSPTFIPDTIVVMHILPDGTSSNIVLVKEEEDKSLEDWLYDEGFKLAKDSRLSICHVAFVTSGTFVIGDINRNHNSEIDVVIFTTMSVSGVTTYSFFGVERDSSRRIVSMKQIDGSEYSNSRKYSRDLILPVLNGISDGMSSYFRGIDVDVESFKTLSQMLGSNKLMQLMEENDNDNVADIIDDIAKKYIAPEDRL